MANLKDLIDDGVMKYDGYEGTMFGILGGALTVVGGNGKRGNPKKYILTCSICSSDTELHGEGYFAMAKGHLERGCLPCGCSTKCNWTEEQYIIRAKRAASFKGVVFKGWANTFSTANKTLVTLECPDHGEYKGNSLSFLLDENLPKGCPGCFAIRQGDYKRKDDQVMVNTFMSTGGYSKGTIFRRSGRVDIKGHKKYWFVYCPDCNVEGETHLSCLSNGSRCCACPKSRPQETYINFIKEGEHIVSIKFGVANSSEQRVKAQNNRAVYTIENYAIWEYPDIMSCRSAERECLQSLVCGVVTREEVPDGWTETTSPLNIEKVISIFESNGGVRKV